jgi:hypothetical protein
MIRNTLLFIALLAPFASVHAADGWKLGAGADYSSGDYGSDTTTTIWSVPVTARYDTGAWTFKASLPWLQVNGDVNVLPGLGEVGNSNPNGRGNGKGQGNPSQPTPATPETGSASGIGDLRLYGIYAFDTGTPLGIDLSANVKIATADEDKALGTGANDYGLALDLYRDIDGTTVFGGVSYTLLGDSEFIDTNDVFGANIGVSHDIAVGALGMSYDWRQAASDTADDRSELTGFWSVHSSETTKWQLYGVLGLSDGSPDWGGGVSISHAF